MSWMIPLIHALLFALCLLGILRLNKELRGKRGALATFLSFDDILCVVLVSLLHTAVLYFLSFGVSLVVSSVLFVYGLLVFVDAMLFVQYRIEVNRQTLAWFFTGSRGLKKGIPHLFEVFRKFPAGALIPLLLMALITLAHYEASSMWLNGVANISASWSNVFMLVSGASVILALLALGLILTRKRPWFSSAFLTTPTLLTNILADDDFKANEQVALSAIHQNFVNPPSEKPKPSDMHGVCQGANVIMITFESLGAYVEPHVKDVARSRLAERLAEKSWVSEKHFCLCPNTTVATNQIYTGAYSNNPYNKDDSLYPGVDPRHVKQLKRAGYKTFFLDSADIGLYDYHKLLSRIGFDRIWGTNDLPSNGLKADYRLWNMVDVIAEEVGEQPFYLHIINDQTHMPYEVVDKQRFNRHSGNSQKDLYLNAVEEVDYILDTFLERLGQKIDLSDTILVFTGDHGESFGEYGYSFHSNSVIMPQMHVPFMLHHPRLGSRKIEHSCHFDLFPTFFDLLGIDCDYPTLGNSIACNERAYAYFFHSATLKGNTPANFGFLLDGEFIWMDRLFNRMSVMQQGKMKAGVRSHDREYFRAMLYQMLKQRGILSQ